MKKYACFYQTMCESNGEMNDFLCGENTIIACVLKVYDKAETLVSCCDKFYVEYEIWDMEKKKCIFEGKITEKEKKV